ncbi:MAG: hypothetical protein C0598_07700 [Marinilabiliales bacterium]|nr:MAG: hypothetical protein C0598_07700 [Marinilabiliales bacterium]
MNYLKNIILILSLLLFTIAAKAQNAELHGRIFDAVNNEPIAFANIIVDGTQIGTTSEFEGNFIITGLKPGFVKLRASYVGYKTKVSSDIIVSNTNIPYIELAMEPSEQLLKEVVITVDPFEKKQEAPLSMQSIGVKEIESNPGSNRDISRVIQSFPGVGSTPAFRNDVISRGGGPSENRFFMDGIEIPVLNHFATQGASGGPVGIINADFIENVDFYSGSFPANKYNALSGILDFRQKEGSKDKTNIQATLGASEIALTLDGPIGKKTSYIFSIRRSYLQFLFSAIGLPFLPTYNDYQLKLKTNFNKKNQLTIISIGSLDQLTLNTGIKDPDESQEYILAQIPVNNQWSYTFGVNYKNFFKNGFHTFVFSRNMLNNSFYKYPDNDDSKPKTFDYLSTEAENKLRYELSMRKNGFKYIFTGNLEYADYYNKTYQQLYLNDSLIDFNYTTSFNMVKYGASAQVSKKILNNNLLVSAGLRFDGNNYNSNTSNPLNQLSPRVSLSYSLTEKDIINFGVGRYFQQAAYTTLGFRNNAGDLVNKDGKGFIGVNHINLGYEHRFSEAILLSAEGFYKDYFQYPIDLINGVSLANQGAEYSSVAGAAPVSFTGKGRAVGFELLSRINLKSFNFLGSYTFVRSLFTDLKGDYIPSSWDSRHLLTLTGTKSFDKNWRVGFKWRFVGGLPYTPYDLETSANIEAWNARGQAYFDFSELNTLRFEAFHQLDLRVDKNFFFDKWALMVYIDIQNVYNFQNRGQDYIIREKNPDGSFKTTNNGQDYVLKSVENFSGTVLPTLGIMIKL